VRDLTEDDAFGPDANLASRFITPTRYRAPSAALHPLASAAVLLVAVVMVAIFLSGCSVATNEPLIPTGNKG
jgi:hypothetical protein